MKILFFNEFTLIPGGVDNVVETEYNLLSGAGINIVPFYYHNSKYRCSSLKKKISILRSSMPGDYLLVDFQNIINKFKPDIIHFHNIYQLFGSPIWNRIIPGKTKIILHLHNYYPFCLNSFFFRKKQFCSSCLKHNSWIPGIMRKCYQESYLRSFFTSINRIKPEKWIYSLNKVASIIAVSRYTAETYIRCGVPDKIISIIPNPVSLNMKPSNHSIITNRAYILFLGSIREEKGIDLFINAALSNPSINFVAAGDGPDMVRYKRNYSGLNNLIFTGFLSGEKKDEVLRNARFVFHPSRCPETFGLTVLEAYSYGIPVLTTAAGGIKEIFIEGRTGRLYKDIYSVKDFWNELDTKYIYYKKNCEEFIKDYLPEKHLNELLSVYHQVIK